MEGVEEDFRAGRGFSTERLSKYARTKSGVAWLAEALHPPVAQDDNAGMPDHDCSTSAVVRYKPEYTITPPTDVGTGDWSCVVYVLPNLQALSVVRKWKVSTPNTVLTEYVGNRRFPDITTGAQMMDLVTRQRQIARSATFRLDAPALSDQGMVYSCQVRPATTTGYANLNNVITTRQDKPASNLAIAHNFQTPGDVTEASAKSYTGHARDGCYIPIAFSEPVNPYRSSVQVNRPDTELYQRFIDFLEDDDTTTSLQLSNGLPFADGNMGVALFTGLSAQATIELKNNVVFEVIPTSRSTWMPFQTPGATPDTMALDNYFVIRHAMPDAFNEEANFLGALAGLASTILPALASWAVPKITSWLSAKSTPATPPPLPPRQPVAPKALVVPPPKPPRLSMLPKPVAPPKPTRLVAVRDEDSRPVSRSRSRTRRQRQR